MYNTNDMLPKTEKWKEPIKVTVSTEEKYNPFQVGYGAHGKSKNARNRAIRQENKKLCKEF